MTEALDLGPLDAGLARLLEATSGANLAPAVLREGETIADVWRSGVESAGLVRTGAYRDSIFAKPTRRTPGSARVSVRTEIFYAGFQEYGTRFIPARPVGRLAFLRSEEPVIEAIAEAIREQIQGISPEE